MWNVSTKASLLINSLYFYALACVIASPSFADCPQGYVSVPKTPAYTTADFCIAKYEAKNSTNSLNGSGAALSIAAGNPWTKIAQIPITRDAARAACQANGTRYDLIGDAEWNATAKNIESAGTNWSGGAPSSGSINQGNNDNLLLLPLAASLDTNPCFGLTSTCSQSIWNAKRRTHTLTNGDIIWDFSGNVWEYLRDKPVFRGGGRESKSLASLHAETNTPLDTGFRCIYYTGPTSPNITINAGATYTNSNSVTLTLSANDNPSMMYITPLADCNTGGAWEPYSPTRSWPVRSNVTNTIYVKFKDLANHESTCVAKSIIHDSIASAPPSGIKLVTPTLALGNISQPTFNITGVTAGDTISLHTDNLCATPAKALSIATGSTLMIKSSSLLTDGPYTFYAKSTDPANNTSTCSTASASYTLDTTPPSSPTLSINQGAAYTNAASVNLNLSASDSPKQVYITKNADCISGGGWQDFLPVITYIHRQTTGPLKLYALYKDAAGNTSSCVNSSIVIDTIPPLAPSAITLTAPTSNKSSNPTPTLRVQGVTAGDLISLHTDLNCSDRYRKAYGTAKSSSIDLTSDPLSPNTSYNFYAKATDPAGNSTCSKTVMTYFVTINSISIAITSPANNSFINQASPIKSFRVAGTCSMSGRPVIVTATKVNPVTTNCFNGTWSTTLDLTNSPEGVSGLTITAKSSDFTETVSAQATINITKDLTPPSSVVISTPSNNSTMNGSGIISGTCSETGTNNITIVVENKSAGTLDCTRGTFSTQSKPLDLSSIKDGLLHFKAILNDAAGNTLTSSPISIFKDTLPPISPRIIIENGANYTFKSSLSLSLSTLDYSTQMYITETPGCASGGSWEPYLPKKTWTLNSTFGTRVIYAKFKDAAQNESICASDDIYYTNILPSILINNGATDTRYTSVTLSLTGPNSPTQMYITPIAGCTTGGRWETFAASKPWNLIYLNQRNTLYAQFKDANGKLSDCVNTSIIHDDIAPSPPNALAIDAESVKIPNNPTPTIVVYGLGFMNQVEIYTNASCSGSTPLASGTAKKAYISLTTTPLTAGSYIFYAKLLDLAGNSVCSTASIQYAINATDSTSLALPSPTISINNGSTYTKSSTVALSLSVGGSPSQMYITNTAGCNSGGIWESYSTSKTGWALQQTNAVATVYVKYRDAALNESTCASDAIIHDSTAPLAPSTLTLVAPLLVPSSTATPTIQINGLTVGDVISLHTDSTCSLASQKAIGTASASTLNLTSSALSADGTYFYYAKATDPAGNSTCSTAAVAYDFYTMSPSLPTIAVAGGAAYTSTNSVPLTLSATGATEMYVTNTAGCTSGGTWTTYATSKTGWTLAQTNGTATVYVKYRNTALNESTCASDTIIHDSVAPNTPGAFNDGTTTTSLTSAPQATWSASSDATSGISYYEIAIGTTLGGNEVYGWSNVGNVTTATITGLFLDSTKRYYTSVRVRDSAGNVSSISQGDGWTFSICPANYVEVPRNSTYTSSHFCIAKYEAKQSGSSAISLASGTPWTSITQTNAITACQANGTGYDLINNAEWQTVAQNIESVGTNWKNGTLGNGSLNRGHSDGTEETGFTHPLIAHTNDTNACYGTGQTCSDSLWDTQRRTHVLSNGQVLWDLAGNASEWIKDTNSTYFGENAYLSQITSTSHVSTGTIGSITSAAKTLFGASGNYTTLNSIEYAGLGYGYLNSAAGGITRGGSWNDDVNSGVFAVDLRSETSSSSANLGFRCVYHP